MYNIYVLREGSSFTSTSARCKDHADNNRCNVNGTPNYRAVRQMVRSTGPELSFGNVFAQPSVPFSVWVMGTKFKVANCVFSNLSNLVEENIYQRFQKNY